MGCGGSLEVTPAKYAPPTAQKSAEEEREDERKIKKKLKGKKDKEKHAEHADVIWHQKHCEHGQLVECQTIAEAYPFDESSQKSVTKVETVMTGGERVGQASAAGKWGSCNIAKLGPSRILCDVCGVFILDKDSRTPFYVCVNCRSHKRKLEVCVKCYHDRAAEKPPAEVQRATTPGKGQKRDKVPEKGALPNGIWTAVIKERKSTRKVSYKLTFTGKGDVLGEGPDKSKIHGTLANNKVEWKETHAWGTLTVTAEYSPVGKRPTISGTFEASDDGCGSIEFVYCPDDDL